MTTPTVPERPDDGQAGLDSQARPASLADLLDDQVDAPYAASLDCNAQLLYLAIQGLHREAANFAMDEEDVRRLTAPLVGLAGTVESQVRVLYATANKAEWKAREQLTGLGEGND